MSLKDSFSILIKSLLFLAVLFLPSEFLLRFLGSPNYRLSDLYSNIEFYEKTFRMHPNSFVVQEERYGDIKYEFNKEGFRDKNHEINTNNHKIIILGDSVSFGLGVRQNLIYPRLLENKLNKNNRNKFEVLNFSLFAYGINHELIVLKDFGLKYKPSLIILQFYMNDLLGYSFQTSNNVLDFSLEKINNKLLASEHLILYKSLLYKKLKQMSSRLFYLMFHDLRRQIPFTLNSLVPQECKDCLLNLKKNDTPVEYFKLLKEMSGIAKSNGINFILVISPNEVQLFNEDYDVINASVFEFCGKEGIICLDPLNEMRASSLKLKFFNDGVHFSQIGHDFFANHLLKELNLRKLI